MAVLVSGRGHTYLVLVVRWVGHVSRAQALDELQVLLAQHHVLPSAGVAHGAPEVGVFTFPAHTYNV